MDNEFIYKDKIDIKYIVKELYDLNKVGAISIPGVVSHIGRMNLIESIVGVKNLFWKAPKLPSQLDRSIFIYRKRAIICPWENFLINRESSASAVILFLCSPRLPVPLALPWQI